VEIVGDAPTLLYDTEEAAAETILRVATNSSEQQRLREHLAWRATLFGTDRFMNEVREIVTNFRE
jgi:hypothetical protein